MRFSTTNPLPFNKIILPLNFSSKSISTNHFSKMKVPSLASQKLMLVNKKNYIVSKSSNLIKNTYNNSPSYQSFTLQNLYNYKMKKYSPQNSATENTLNTATGKTSSLTWKRFSSNSKYIQTKNKASQYGAFVSNSRKFKWSVITTLSLFAFLLYYVLSLADEDFDEEDDSPRSRRIRSSKKIKIVANDWMFFFYSTLPFNALSRLWGKVNSVTLPEWFRPYGYSFYSYVFGANLDEMVDPDLKHYKNLSEFFYRMITPESRPIEESSVIVCPSDGKVLQMGEINPLNGEIEQVKGMTYNVKQFLGTHSHPLMNKSIIEYGNAEANLVNDIEPASDFESESASSKEETSTNVSESEEEGLSENDIEQVGDKAVESTHPITDSHYKILKDVFNNPKTESLKDYDQQNKKLVFAVIYLAPGDYHHYHSPVDWIVKIRRHFPGELFSVAPYFQKNFPNLFVLNERVALLGEWKYGFFSMTPVGATNVGSIKLNFDKDLITNAKKKMLLNTKDDESKHHIIKAKKKDKGEQHATCFEATYSNNNPLINGVPLFKGEEMGGFMLGSTVVLCFEAPKDFAFDIKVGDKIKMGQTLGHFENNNAKK
ncbi:hypothetical protein ACO0QE_001014 [Hanseniaspora vineae]